MTIITTDVLEGFKKVEDESFDVVLIDPPYNIGKDFGITNDTMELSEYIEWSKQWINESIRVLKPSGTIYIYGFAEILAHLSVNFSLEHRWLQWHYENKTTPSYNFWQRTHESILCGWKDKEKRIFNRDDVREPYTKEFLKGSAGKERKTTKGRFQKTDKQTKYTAHKNGALPRDVIEIPALAGGAGKKERKFFCRECDNIFDMSLREVHENDGHSIYFHETQKPMKLTKKLLLACKNKNEKTKVLVPFVGTGSELVVAKNLGFEYLGFEINPDYKKLAEKMLETFSDKEKPVEFSSIFC